MVKSTLMKGKGDYRRRVFDNYVSSHNRYISDLSVGGYDITLKELEKNYLRFLPKNSDMEVLEVASGPGHFAWFLKKYGYKNYTGIDLSAEQVECARKMLPGYEFIITDAFEYLEDKMDKYDLVYAGHVLEHLYKQEALDLLDLAYKALKPGGVFIAVVPNCGSPLFGNHSRHVDLTHETGFTPESMRQILRIAGFDVKFCGVVRKARAGRDMYLRMLDALIGMVSKRGISIYPEIYVAGERVNDLQAKNN